MPWRLPLSNAHSRRQGQPHSLARAALILVVTTTALAGCIDERPPPPMTFPVASETAAAARVRDFFHAYALGDLDAAAGFICEIGVAERDAVKSFIARSHAPNAPIRVDQVEVRAVASHWDGEEPTFWVEVAFPMREGKGRINSAYRVRVRSGCIENFVNAIPNDQSESSGETLDDDKAVPARLPTLPPPASVVPPLTPLFPDPTDTETIVDIPPIVPVPPDVPPG